MQLRSHSYMNT
ncbi:hypothetical protein Hamer_G023051 [Homarus americanus]|uniref:Uncharacterized protein n=1 Tax=Homarus americanus TaxID=6706 RepID=A0A8J5JN27_HOMAM|nr:hypothetical protein Hamer_G023051 [Homarus americanus]